MEETGLGRHSKARQNSGTGQSWGLNLGPRFPPLNRDILGEKQSDKLPVCSEAVSHVTECDFCPWVPPVAPRAHSSQNTSPALGSSLRCPARRSYAEAGRGVSGPCRGHILWVTEPGPQGFELFP